MKIIIAGATGFIGTPLCKELLKKGNSLTILTRNFKKAQNRFGNSVEIVEWDAKTFGDWSKCINDSDAVINLTGESIGGESIIPSRWTKLKKEKILLSRIDSTKVIVLSIEKSKAKPKVFINASAVGYYGNVESDDVTEDYPPGNDFLGNVAKKWEEEAAKAENLGLRVVRVRTGIVLEKNGGALPRLLLPFKSFAGGHLGSGEQWFPWVHFKDEINSIIFSLENEKISGAVNIASSQIVTMKEFCKVLGKVMKRPVWAPAPAFVLKTVLGEMSDLVLKGQKVIPKKLLDNGYKFLFPELEEALKDILGK